MGSVGVTSISNGGNGAYIVTFPGDVTNCAPTVTLNTNAVPGFADAYQASNFNIGVTTWDKTGAPTNHPFYISVLCDQKTYSPA